MPAPSPQPPAVEGMDYQQHHAAAILGYDASVHVQLRKQWNMADLPHLVVLWAVVPICFHSRSFWGPAQLGGVHVGLSSLSRGRLKQACEAAFVGLCESDDCKAELVSSMVVGGGEKVHHALHGALAGCEL